MIRARTVWVAAIVAIAIAIVSGCGRTRTNTYALEITGPTESERVRLLLDGREIAAFPGYAAIVNVSLDERTPFPIASPSAALTGEFFGPDGWTATTATIVSQGWPDAIESQLAKGETLPIGILVWPPELSRSLRVYVDNRGRKQAARIALGHAERSVAANEAVLIEFLSPTRDEGTPIRVDGVEVGRVQLEKAIEQHSDKQVSWLVDVSGQRTYRRRFVVYQERHFSYGTPYQRDPGTILKAARLHEIPGYKIDYFLTAAPSMITSPDLALGRLELLDAK